MIEKVRRFIVADEPFTIENEQLTPSMKIRRHVISKVYGERLDALYAPLDALRPRDRATKSPNAQLPTVMPVDVSTTCAMSPRHRSALPILASSPAHSWLGRGRCSRPAYALT